MPWAVAAAGIAAAGSIGSSIIGSNAAKDATKAQTNAAGQAAAYLQPYMDAGGNSLAALQKFIGIGPGGSFNPNAAMDSFRSSPGYQFSLDQGIGAINNRATTGAGVNSGNTLSALMQYGQGLASRDYRTYQQDTLSALSGLTDIGKQAAGASGGIALQSGNALAAGSVAQGNVFANALNGLSAGGGGNLQQLYQSMFGQPNLQSDFAAQGAFGGPGGKDYMSLLSGQYPLPAYP